MSEGASAGLIAGLRAEAQLTVNEEQTAAHWGSGGVDVLATPEMVCLMERAAVAAVGRHVPAGCVTVGVHLDVAHLAATPVGMRVTARAELIAIEGRKLTFHVEAHDERELVGQGTHQRAIVDLARFRERAAKK